MASFAPLVSPSPLAPGMYSAAFESNRALDGKNSVKIKEEALPRRTRANLGRASTPGTAPVPHQADSHGQPGG